MDFISMETFLTFAGCLVVVAIVTQAIKNIPPLKDINSAWSALIVSVVVGIVRLIFVGDFSATGIIVGIFNIFVIYLGSIGGYESVKQITQYFSNK